MEQVQARWGEILNFDKPDHPENMTDADILVCHTCSATPLSNKPLMIA
jgi:hypothetical protein